MEEDRRELRDYYVESSPARRRQILNVAMETQSDPEADEIRLQIWKLRYAKARRKRKERTGRRLFEAVDGPEISGRESTWDVFL